MADPARLSGEGYLSRAARQNPPGARDIPCRAEVTSRGDTHHRIPGRDTMTKGLEQKKETKKKPTKTLKEKRADKAAKKGK
jgi:hypothetical protein